SKWQVQCDDVLPEERRCEPVSRKPRLAARDHRGRQIDAVNVLALLQQGNQQASRSRHRFERWTGVLRQARDVPRDLGIGGPRLVGVVEERAKAAVRGHRDSASECNADIVPRITAVASLELFPRQAFLAPAGKRTAMMVLVERALEPFENVVDLGEAGLFERHSSVDRAVSAAAYEHDGTVGA